ncbi:hypothetical protein [Caballeronia novacaledonica]|uniref:Uncharacterized protein n=1 Tax=Caballeronia novacaledonica TaxID=1544861 RepID=A0AA37MIZ8_9BURK|nr:hypothetical protein [Caballeronia novacaledonica]GJH29310.1 hypothetical protein CBA19CS42_32360 [Caballeronia novacaledonica]
MTHLSHIRCVACLLPILLAACVGVRPYSETRDKQGQAIAASTDDVYQTLKSSFVTGRENNEALLKQEQNATKEVEAARRDAIIAVLVWGTVGAQLNTPVAAQLNKVAGPDATAYFDSLADIKLADKQLANIRAGMRVRNVDLPDCKQLLSPGGDRNLPPEAANAKTLCAGRAAAETAANEYLAAGAPPNPRFDISVTALQLANEQAELDAEMATTAKLRQDFSKAQEAYDKAIDSLAEGKGDVEPLRSEARRLAGELRGIATKLEAAADVFSKQFISNERRNALDKFFDVAADLGQGRPIPQGTSRAAMALVLFPDTIDKTKEDLTEARKLPWAGLILRKRYEETQYNAATADITLRKERINLLRTKQNLQEGQALQLLNAQDGLLSLPPGFEKRSMLRVLGEAPSKRAPGEQDINERVYEAAGRYIYARTQAQADIDNLDGQIHAVEFRRRISYAEANAEQWNILISANAGQLSAYGASGIKPEMLLSLFNSLMLLWIAIGVN